MARGPRRRGVRRPRRPGWLRRRDLRLRDPPRLGESAERRTLDRARLAGRVRRAGRVHRPAGHLERGVRAPDAPGRVGVFGEGLLGPTLIPYGTPTRNAPVPARRSSPAPRCGARATPSPTPARDLANVQTRAVLDGDEWVITGQKVWTSLAQWADWCFVVCRTEPGSPPPQGPQLSARPHGPARGRGAADHPAHRDQRVQRGVLRRGPDRARHGGGRGRRRMAGGPGHARLRAGRGPARHHLQFRRELDEVLDLARNRRRPATPCCANGWPTPGSGCSSSAPTPCASRGATARSRRPRRRSPSSTGPPGTARSASWPSTCCGPAGLVLGGDAGELTDLQRLFLFSRRHHLRRVQRDPAQHHRRARPRSRPEPRPTERRSEGASR